MKNNLIVAACLFIVSGCSNTLLTGQNQPSQLISAFANIGYSIKESIENQSQIPYPEGRVGFESFGYSFEFGLEKRKNRFFSYSVSLSANNTNSIANSSSGAIILNDDPNQFSAFFSTINSSLITGQLIPYNVKIGYVATNVDFGVNWFLSEYFKKLNKKNEFSLGLGLGLRHRTFTSETADNNFRLIGIEKTSGLIPGARIDARYRYFIKPNIAIGAFAQVSSTKLHFSLLSTFGVGCSYHFNK